jgi:hypothetical protein
MVKYKFSMKEKIFGKKNFEGVRERASVSVRGEGRMFNCAGGVRIFFSFFNYQKVNLKLNLFLEKSSSFFFPDVRLYSNSN